MADQMKALLKQVKELEDEVRKLKGIKTYQVDVPLIFTYYVEATDAEDAVVQANKRKDVEAAKRAYGETVVKEIDNG